MYLRRMVEIDLVGAHDSREVERIDGAMLDKIDDGLEEIGPGLTWRRASIMTHEQQPRWIAQEAGGKKKKKKGN